MATHLYLCKSTSNIWHCTYTYAVLIISTLCCSSLAGAYRVADGAVADAGGHCCWSRYASGLTSIIGRSAVPRATAHPQLPGAHPSQCAGEAERQWCPSANVEATERGATSGHTTKIRASDGCTDKCIIVPSCRKGGEVSGYDGDEAQRWMMASLSWRYQWILKISVDRYNKPEWIVHLGFDTVQPPDGQRTSVNGPQLHQERVCIREFCLHFLDVPQRY